MLPNVYDVKNSPSNGILIFSTACEECPFPSITIQAPTGELIKYAGGGSTMFDKRIEVDQPYSSKHAQDTYPADYKGRLLVATLPSGEYKIVRCATWFRWGNTEYYSKIEPPIKFTITAGKINYLGQVTVIYNESKPKNGFNIKFDNQLQRDQVLALSNYPILAETPIVSLVQ